jgi:hypothetical protein
MPNPSDRGEAGRAALIGGKPAMISGRAIIREGRGIIEVISHNDRDRAHAEPQGAASIVAARGSRADRQRMKREPLRGNSWLPVVVSAGCAEKAATFRPP